MDVVFDTEIVALPPNDLSYTNFDHLKGLFTDAFIM